MSSANGGLPYEVRIDPHTKRRARERGATIREVLDVLRTGFPLPAKRGRMAKTKVYEFGKQRAGRRYEQKRVDVYYAVEGRKLVTVTVYVFYGKWGSPS